MNKKTISIVMICMLIGLCFLSSVTGSYPQKENKGKDELVKIHEHNYYDMDKVSAIVVFYTALQNGIDFDTAIKMGFNQLEYGYA